MSSVRTRLGRLGILRPLSIRDFAWLWIGMTVSMVGDGIYIVAIAWQVYQLSNTPTALAAVGIAWSLPQIILLLASGVLSDRVDRRHLMIAGDILRLLAIGTSVCSPSPANSRSRCSSGSSSIYGVGQALFGPAFSSIVPSIVPAELLVEANSLGQFVRPFAMTLIGPLIGGLLVGSVGAGWAFIADALTFAFSAVMIMLIHARPTERDPADESSFWADTKEGIRYVKDRPWLWAALIGAFVSLLVHVGPVGDVGAVHRQERAARIGDRPGLGVRRRWRGVGAGRA